MKTELADVNVLVAIGVAQHEYHQSAMEWLSKTSQFATTPVTEMGLVRLLLNPRVIQGLRIEDALQTLRSIRAFPTARFWPDATSLADQRAVTAHVVGTKQVTDTHLFNLAVANGGILVTFDARLRNSLAAKDREHVRVLDSSADRYHQGYGR